MVQIHPTQVVLETNGIGYEIEISLKTFEAIKERESVRLFIQQIVREDAHYLFGFSDIQAKELFKKLISVSGIGPNTGRLILSGLSVSEVVQAIRQESDRAFKQVKGVGPKTAKRIILDLKDKVNDIQVVEMDISGEVEKTPNNTIYDESLSALVALGFRRAQVIKAVNKVLSEQAGDARVEDVIKSALKALTGSS